MTVCNNCRFTSYRQSRSDGAVSQHCLRFGVDNPQEIIGPLHACAHRQAFVVPAPTTSTIFSFEDEYAFLSNFYPSPFDVPDVDGGSTSFDTVEHFFQAMKAEKPEDFERIRHQPTPGRAKRYGRMVQLRRGWDDMRLEVMRAGVFHKFDQNHDLAAKLLATGDAELIEGNVWKDTFWGVCDGKGENWLGKILMEVRTELRASRQFSPPTLASMYIDDNGEQIDHEFTSEQEELMSGLAEGIPPTAKEATVTKVTIYTDGGATDNQNPDKRKGYCSFAVYFNGKRIDGLERHPEGDATNQHAELLAIMRGLEWLMWRHRTNNDRIDVEIRTDSQYALGHIFGTHSIKQMKAAPKSTRLTCREYIETLASRNIHVTGVKANRDTEIAAILGH